jgi:ATP-dependent Clp protease ATP-binding subunit ClpC
MSQHMTSQSRKVLARANEAAKSLNHSYVGTEHILLGLLEQGSSSVAEVLNMFGVDAARARTEIENAVQPGLEPVSSRILPLTPRAKRALQNAGQEALYMNERCVHPEHLLLGLVEEREGVAGQVLRTLGIAPEALRAEVFRIRLAQSKIVERTVRPVRASTARKRKMREELLAHLTAIYDQEQARCQDPNAAHIAAAQRFGDPAELSRELDAALPYHERISHFVERFFAYRAPESATHYSLRMAIHTFVMLAVILGLVTVGVYLGFGWIETVQTMARVLAAIVLLTPPAQFVAWWAYIKMRDAMWGAFGSRKSIARVLVLDILIGLISAVYIMAIAVVSSMDFGAATVAIGLCGLVHVMCSLACIVIAYLSGPTEIRDTIWALLDLEEA